MSSAKVCFLPRDHCGGQSRLKAGAKTSTRPSEVSGERIEPSSSIGAGRREYRNALLWVAASGGTGRSGISNARKRVLFLETVLLPSEPNGLATKRLTICHPPPFVNSPSPWGLLDSDIYFVGSLAACL